jgi:hypothetical protein
MEMCNRCHRPLRNKNGSEHSFSICIKNLQVQCKPSWTNLWYMFKLLIGVQSEQGFESSAIQQSTVENPW